MKSRTSQQLAVAGGVAWLAVAGYGIWELSSSGDGGWELAYALFSVALVLGAGLTLAAAALVSTGSRRPRLRIAGLVAGGLGCALGLIAAWALPVWMTLLGVGFAMVAAASEPARRRVIGLLAGGQVIGIAVLITSIEAEVGRADEYGDYPAAGGIALIFVAAVMIVALVGLARGWQGRDVAAYAG
jgi:hypothetical protein